MEGPSTQLTFLGIELDTTEMVRRLPRRKIKGNSRRLVAQKILSSQGPAVTCQKGRAYLQGGSPRRTFLGRMLELLRGAKRKQFLSDQICNGGTSFWRVNWNGVTMLANIPQTLTCNTDASGSFDCGVWWQEGWLQLQWPEDIWQRWG